MAGPASTRRRWRDAAPLVAAGAFLSLGSVGCAHQAEESAFASAAGEHHPTGWLTFDCTSGDLVRARYLGPDAAQVEARGRVRAMKLAISASGARYVGDGLEWWTKGSGAGASGTLLTQRGDAMPGEPLDTCRQRR